MQVLIDTSVWSAALRRPAAKALVAKQTASQLAAVAALKDLIADGRAILIGAVRQELLSGVKTAAQFENLREMLSAFPDFAVDTQDHERAAQLFNQCQAKGVQGAHTDFLICAVALRYQLAILSLDQDFVHFQKCLPISLLALTKAAL